MLNLMIGMVCFLAARSGAGLLHGWPVDGETCAASHSFWPGTKNVLAVPRLRAAMRGASSWRVRLILWRWVLLARLNSAPSNVTLQPCRCTVEHVNTAVTYVQLATRLSSIARWHRWLVRLLI